MLIAGLSTLHSDHRKLKAYPLCLAPMMISAKLKLLTRSKRATENKMEKSNDARLQMK